MEQITTNKQKALLAGKKSLGTLQKVLSMIEEDKYCPEIIQQVDAVIGLLRSTKKELLTGHLHHCLSERLEKDESKTIDELIQIYGLNGK